jgi:cell division transport system permease protein
MNKPILRKFRITYLTTIISLTLLLFILGIQIYLWLAAKKFSNNISNNISIELVLKNEVSDIEIANFKSMLDVSKMVESTQYISKEEAASRFEKELGENFLELTGYNPLFSSIEVHLKPEFNTDTSINSWIESNKKFPFVEDVIYNGDVAGSVSKSIIKINLIISAFTVMLLISALLMIYNNNRISVFNERFAIKTMYLVGASHSYILKPFLFRALRHSLYSILLSSLFLYILFKYVGNIIPELNAFADILFYLKLFGILSITGVIFTLLSTAFAINTVLKGNPDKIY